MNRPTVAGAYTSPCCEPLEPRLLLHAAGVLTYAHQWIALEAYHLYESQQPDSGLEYHMGLGATEKDWIANSFKENNNNLLQGTADEDAPKRLPNRTKVAPYVTHFVAGADGEELLEGLPTALVDDFIAAGFKGATQTVLPIPIPQLKQYVAGKFGAAARDLFVSLSVPYRDDPPGTFFSAYERASQLWENYVKPSWDAGNRALSYYYLGHVAHLLADMTVPAHVHNDPHVAVLDDADFYEVYAGKNFKNYTAASLTRLDEPASLEDLFRTTINYTKDYDSNDADGKHGTSTITPDRHHPDRVSRSDGISEAEGKILADDLLPFAIEQTAALYSLFFQEMDPTILPILQVTAKTPAKFLDASSDLVPSDLVTVSLTGPGTATLQFLTDGPADIFQLTVEGTTAKSSLTIATAATAGTAINAVWVRDPLGSFTAKTTDLTSTFSTENTLGALVLRDVVDDRPIPYPYITISIGNNLPPDTQAPVALTFRRVDSQTVSSVLPIKSLTAAEVLSTSGRSMIWAPSLGALSTRKDARRGIAGDFTASLSLTLNPQFGSGSLGSATIAGKLGDDAGELAWDIPGNAGTITVGSIGIGCLRIAGNCKSLNLGAGGPAEIFIDGNAPSIRTAQTLRVAQNPKPGWGSISVGGTGSVTGAGETLRLNNGQVYTITGGAYGLEEVMGSNLGSVYNWWDYDVAYRATIAGQTQSGSGTARVTVSDTPQNIGGHLSNVVSTTFQDATASVAWYTDGTGTYATAWSNGGFDLTLQTPRVAPPLMHRGQLYSGTSPFSGTFSAQGIDGTVQGTAKITSKFLGHGLVTSGGYIGLAAQLEINVSLNGTLQIDYEGEYYTGSFTGTQKTIYWGVPDLGVVKAVTTVSTRVAISGVGAGTGTLAMEMWLTDMG